MSFIDILLSLAVLASGLLNWMLGRELRKLAAELTDQARIACTTSITIDGKAIAPDLVETIQLTVRDMQRRHLR